MLNKLRWKVYIIWLSLKWCFQVNLGDEVWYRGLKYNVLNGVHCGEWRLVGPDTFGHMVTFDNGRDGWVPRKDCKKVKTLSNYIHSFKSGYWFYMTSWYDIWVREGILDWMKGCNIWPKRR